MPREVTVAPPLLVTLPPLLADVEPTALALVVVKDGQATDEVVVKDTILP